MIEPLKNSVWGWITLSDASVVEIMLLAGASGVIVDLEHTGIGIETCVQHIRIANLMKKPVCVRLPSHDFGLAKRALDCGADLIMFPDVRTLEQAAACIEATIYKPRGSRGVGIWRAQNYDLDNANSIADEFKAPQKRAILQIEDIGAFDDLDRIIESPMLAGIFVGPYDLSASLGAPGDFAGPEFSRCVDELLSGCKSRRVPIGFHQVEPDQDCANRLIERGFDFLAYGTDYKFLGAGMKPSLSWDPGHE